MKARSFLFCIPVCSCCFGQSSSTSAYPRGTPQTPADDVKPLSGMAQGRWFFFNSACRPFGTVNLSPDARTGGDWNNRYLFGDSKIRCLSHVHGWPLYEIAVLPFTGTPKGHLGMDTRDRSRNLDARFPRNSSSRSTTLRSKS